MQQIAFYVSKYGLSLVFLNVLLEQLGLPIPAMPVLVVAGALAVERDLSAPRVLIVAVVACLIADALWYQLGDGHVAPGVSAYSTHHRESLLGQTFDRVALAQKGLAYERLDQLTMELLLGVR